jgi:hemerythrin-like domain-containing protein
VTESIREHFGEQHVHLERNLERLRDAVEGADSAALVNEWDQFEAALRAHLEAEEERLFPTVEASVPGAVRAARDAHASIRRRLDELGMQVQLHTIRLEVVDDFLEELRAHKEAEDRGLYPAADELLEPGAKARAIERAA